MTPNLHDLWKTSLSSCKLKEDLGQDKLLEEISSKEAGRFTADGAVVVTTGKHTGRAAKDKYIVYNDGSNANISWGADLKKMSPDIFKGILQDCLEYLNKQSEVYIHHKTAGAHKNHAVDIRLVTPSPHHVLFADHMFLPIDHKYKEDQGYTIIHAPKHEIDKNKFDVRSGTVIVTNIEERVIIIAGTQYAGEIKKSIFSILNYLLPESSIFPMHAGCSMDGNKNVSLFFGLSGTGKTTLSTDEGTLLIGDDEHGLCPDGVFNFEGGCYAKTIKLNASSEPDIYKACHRKGTILENVVMSSKGELDFDDNSLAENSRASYPLDAIEERVDPAVGPMPNNVFFLCADAFGVLPPVAKLTSSQAMYYFLSGYTAKVAGTEIGVKEPQATFSTCFGAPFMIRHAVDYANLLKKYLNDFPMQVWLINTGWTGGAYGTGERFPIMTTRSIIRNIQKNQLAETEYKREEIFGLEVPQEISGVDNKILNPQSTWADKKAYENAAKKLANMFHKNFEQYTDCEQIRLEGAPAYKS